MEFMLLFMLRRDAPPPEPGAMPEMTKFANELASQGKLRRGAPLAGDAQGARVRVHDGKAVVRDGPFAESKEIVGGFWILEAASRDEAVDIARRTPHARWGTVEVHKVRSRDTVPDPEAGTPFMMVFGMEPGLTDPDGAKYREMMEFKETLKRDGKYIESAPLAPDLPPARVEKTLVTDGPFAEAKEMVGGYSLVRLADRAEAIDVACRFPHAKWGPIEVREILFFDRT